jgi:hypothetical protein
MAAKGLIVGTFAAIATLPLTDGCTIPRGPRAVERLQSQWKNLALVHLPTHASRHDPIEIHVSIPGSEGAHPGDFRSRSSRGTRTRHRTFIPVY